MHVTQLTDRAEVDLAVLSKILSTELCDLLTSGACSEISRRGRRAYYVVWDKKQSKPFLVKLLRQGVVSWTVHEVKETWERCVPAWGVLPVTTGHINEARHRYERHERDIKAELATEQAVLTEYEHSLVRFDLVVALRTLDGHFPVRRIREVAKLTLPEYKVQFQSDHQKLLVHLLATGLLDQVVIDKGEIHKLYLEEWFKTGSRKRNIVATYEVV